MKIGVFTDILSEDFETAVRSAFEMGFDAVELRNIKDRRVPCLTPEEVREAGEILRKYSMRPFALSPGTYRCSLYDREFADQYALFEQTLDLAVEWGAGAVVTSGVRRHWKDRRGDYRRLIDTLSRCVSAATARGVEVWVENEFGWFNDAPDNILRLQKVMLDLGMKTCWNIAGYYAAGAEEWESFAEALGGNLSCVHISDVLTGSAQRGHLPVGDIISSLSSRENSPAVILDGPGLSDRRRAAEALSWLREVRAGG